MNLSQSDILGLANFLVNLEILDVSKKILETNHVRASKLTRQEEQLDEIVTLIKEWKNERTVRHND